jgi:hypothetical protein
MSGMPHSNPVAIAKESGSPTFEKAAKWTLIELSIVLVIIGRTKR